MKARGYTKYIAEGQKDPPVTPAGNNDFLITAHNLQVKNHLRNLYQYLLENHCVEPVMGFDSACLDIFSRDVLAKIQSGDTSWEAMVPPAVAEIIKKRQLWHGNKITA
jgi:nicotinic acid mononucleotide adenylyltransferase